MKKRLLICVAAISLTSFVPNTTRAQQLQPLSDGQRTTLYVNVAVERQEVIAGPYARYAQKYLGVAAPLADKVLHKVTSVKLADISDMPIHSEIIAAGRISHMTPEKGFPRLTVDKTSAITMSLEESARLAAEKVFEIRRSRLDLITGELGENVFGGGLQAALEELRRLEEEYLSLFLGKQTSQSDFKQYQITPVRDRSTYTVCRFSDTDGLLPENDLSGVPIVLELQPVNGASPTEGLNPQAKPSSKAVPHLIPADMRCRIIFEGVELTSRLLSIRQLGETVYLVQ